MANSLTNLFNLTDFYSLVVGPAKKDYFTPPPIVKNTTHHGDPDNKVLQRALMHQYEVTVIGPNQFGNVTRDSIVGSKGDFTVEEWDSHDAVVKLRGPPLPIAHMFDDLWTWGDHLDARNQGWLLDKDFLRGQWVIKRSMHTDTFDNHEQARAFVEMLVDNGDPLACKAYTKIMAARLTG